MTTDKEVLVTLMAEYAPVLTPHTIVVYLYLHLLKDENNHIRVTYKNLEEQLGFSSATTAGIIETLKELGLIRRHITEVEGPTCYSSCYEVPPIEALSSYKRKQLYDGDNRLINTEIRRQILSIGNVPLEYRRLVEKKHLRAAFDVLGPDNFTVANLIPHFSLDERKVGLWMSNPQFKNEFVKLKQEILQEKEQEVSREKETKIALKSKKRKDPKTADDVYESLMKANMKDGVEIPVEQWQAVQLLRYFCLAYEKCHKRRFVLIPRGNSLSTKEMRDLSTVLDDGFKGDTKRAVKFIDWVFQVKNKDLPDGITGTGILTWLINEFYSSTSTSGKTCKRTDPIEEDFMKWILENVPPDAISKYDLATMGDLSWFKECYDTEKKVPVEVVRVVEEGIKRGVLPGEGNVQFK